MAQRSGPPRLNPNCTFNINLKTDLKRQVGCHSTARLAGQIRFCLIHASRVKTDRPSDRPRRPSERTLLCLSEVQLELGSRPQRGRTSPNGRTEDWTTERDIVHSFSKLLQRRRAGRPRPSLAVLPSRRITPPHCICSADKKESTDRLSPTLPSLHSQRSEYTH